MSAISSRPLSEPTLPTSTPQQRHWASSDRTPDGSGTIDLAPRFRGPSSSNLLPDLIRRFVKGIPGGVARRWRREHRRRKVGRAYDMALEIARVVPSGSQVLDVGCGNGFIAHHLSGILGSRVKGIDLGPPPEARIDYQHFDGTRFPLNDQSLDAVLFCYVLHHAQNLGALLSEVRRTLRAGGLLVVYEDIPKRGWDRLICEVHDRKWRTRTGPCRFLSEHQWREMFTSNGFEICSTRTLSRWRNLAHPVSRRFFLLKRREL